MLQKLKKEQPDIIVITGDLIDANHTDTKTSLQLVEGLVKIAPVYYVIGNHEARTGQSGSFINQMHEMGISILSDSYSVIRVDDDEIVIAGINDPRRVNIDGKGDDAAIAEKALSGLDYDRELYTVLLSHRPELIKTYASFGIDLAFSGHAHGGLIRLPLIGVPSAIMLSMHTTSRSNSVINAESIP